jgi:hypothetical protein
MGIGFFAGFFAAFAFISNRLRLTWIQWLKHFAASFHLHASSTILISRAVSPIQFADQGVDLPVCGFDLAREHRAIVLALGGRELLMQVEHSLYQGDHAGVAGDVGEGWKSRL